MTNIIQLPVIAGVEITTDEQGRFNLNALHKASGLGDFKKPSKWLGNKSTKELISELESQSPNLDSALKINNGGLNQGTYAHELLAISYAGWISPKFQLQVNQAFLDFKSGKLQLVAPTQLSRFEILKIAMEAEEENQRLTAQVTEMSPKVSAFERIAVSDGGMCITNAAKHLQVRPKDLFSFLSQNQWIYKRTGNKNWVAYQDRIQQGVLEHKVTTVEQSDGTEKIFQQVLVTPKGLTKLANIYKAKAA